MKKGLLLINLGTPDYADKAAVRRYLAEFLSDKRVIDLPIFWRYFLLYGFILPFRPKQSAKAYQSIWTKQGSPLLCHSKNLIDKIQHHLGNEYQTALGMRYGKPSLSEALESLKNCTEITVLPLYPQYSSAATGSSLENCFEILKKSTVFPSLTFIRDFYQHPAFITAQAELIQPELDNHDHLLFSYHGLPERQLKKSGCLLPCKTDCKPSSLNNPCYRNQCYHTSRLLAEELSLSNLRYTVSFQSRLGRTPWIEPYTDHTLPLLAAKGIKRLAVACPSFVTDCLETLEEIGIKAKKQWLELGGEQLTLIPCLNDGDRWVNAILSISGMKKITTK